MREKVLRFKRPTEETATDVTERLAELQRRATFQACFLGAALAAQPRWFVYDNSATSVKRVERNVKRLKRWADRLHSEFEEEHNR